MLKNSIYHFFIIIIFNIFDENALVGTQAQMYIGP